ncbi:MAG TPA: shikimate dehydrogenase, partial [Ferruginibacter sp.]|nr:shikimate dehydrogenase [Ferruginibacter sp.]
IRSHTLIINTTPLGTFPEVETYPDIPYSFLSKNHLLYDLVYNPAKTVFLQKGEAAGAAIKNGYEMLLIQAEESWRIWNENQD